MRRHVVAGEIRNCRNEGIYVNANSGDNKDDSAAIEAALAAAAKERKTVVYFRGTGTGDPNWYNLERPLHGAGGWLSWSLFSAWRE